ncbi:MAG: histidinol dehydrogenase [Dokdonella sp.]
MNRIDWNSITAGEQVVALARPAQSREQKLIDGVAEIIATVRRDGDAGVLAMSQRHDACPPAALTVTADEFDAAQASLSDDLKQAIRDAHERIERFHRAASVSAISVETAQGVTCERILRPITRVGLYVPAGSAPLPSTALMLGVPSQIAACPDVILCTPPRADGKADPAVLFAARICGIERVYVIGGAQAIAAMAYGTETVTRCDKIFGPGNAWVTEAKLQVAADSEVAAIDMPAGPSELLVIADQNADPRFVAADLLSQAEHGPDSQVILLSDSNTLIDAVAEELDEQCNVLGRAATARLALQSSRLIEVADLSQAVAISNRYAPEHLILNVADPRLLLVTVQSAGSVFLGAWSPESVGDYCSGTNHVLPTYGHARAWSGVSVASFQKQITVQELSSDGLRGIGACAITLATAEGLDAHARAVSIRLDAIATGASG